MKTKLFAAAMAAAVVFTAGSAMAEGDAKKGKKVFRNCKACHRIGDGTQHATGPDLHNVCGRAAGTAEGFKYSDAMMESGLTWDEDTFKQWVEGPRDLVKRTKMAFGGLRKEGEAEDLMAYISEEACGGEGWGDGED